MRTRTRGRNGRAGHRVCLDAHLPPAPRTSPDRHAHRMLGPRLPAGAQSVRARRTDRGRLSRQDPPRRVPGPGDPLALHRRQAAERVRHAMRRRVRRIRLDHRPAEASAGCHRRWPREDRDVHRLDAAPAHGRASALRARRRALPCRAAERTRLTRRRARHARLAGGGAGQVRQPRLVCGSRPAERMAAHQDRPRQARAARLRRPPRRRRGARGGSTGMEPAAQLARRRPVARRHGPKGTRRLLPPPPARRPAGRRLHAVRRRDQGGAQADAGRMSVRPSPALSPRGHGGRGRRVGVAADTRRGDPCGRASNREPRHRDRLHRQP